MSEDAAHAIASEPPKAEDLSVQTLIVICGCSDGKTRAIAFDNEGKQARKVHGFIRHIQGGKLSLHKEPVVLLQLDETKTSTPPPPKPQPSRFARFCEFIFS